MQSLGVIAFVAGGVAIALLLIWRRAWAERRADAAAVRRVVPGAIRPPKTVAPQPNLGREAAPQATAVEVVATPFPTFEAPTGDLLVPDDRDPVPSIPAPQLDGQSGEEVVRSNGAAIGGDITDHRDQPAAPPGLVATEPQAIDEPTPHLSVPDDRDGVPSSTTRQLEGKGGEDVVPSDRTAPRGDIGDPGEMPATSRDLEDQLDQPAWERTTQTEERADIDVEGAGEPASVGPITEPIAQPAGSPVVVALPAADLDPVGDDIQEAADETDLDSDERQPATPTPRAPRQYRPPRSAPTLRGEKRTTAAVTVGGSEKRLDIKVRLVFERGGFCRLSLIPQKDERLDGEIAASSAAGAIELVPLQDDLYSDVFPAELGSALRDGLEWTAVLSSAKLRWTLAGREVYVLGPDEHLSGYLSMPRALLGATQVVLCTDERAAEVSVVIAASGSPQPTLIEQADGLPVGWKGFAGVRPTVSIQQSGDHDILNVLRPRPDISITLEGGIPIGRNTWLADYPPQIRLRGIVSPETGVLIDGVAAPCGETGAYVVPGWDALGKHGIWCADQSRTYEIAAGLEAWGEWDAYRWSLEGVASEGVVAHPSICGPLVRAGRSTAADRERRVVLARNPVLIGARPGDIAFADMRGALRGGEGIASVSFEPVWALPSNPLHCDKTTARAIALSDEPVEELQSLGRLSLKELSARRAWCDALLDTARKGLQNDPDDPKVHQRWKDYCRRAKALRKRVR